MFVRYVLYLFFFFQAEDGIRDTSVTGVQTCALPIWPIELIVVSSGPKRRLKAICCSSVSRVSWKTSTEYSWNASKIPRSEERRVGKECRSRWAQYHYKKNRIRSNTATHERMNRDDSN